MNTKDLWEIFDAADGRLLQRLYGRANAVLHACGIAFSENKAVGLASSGVAPEYFYPPVSNFYSKGGYKFKRCLDSVVEICPQDLLQVSTADLDSLSVAVMLLQQAIDSELEMRSEHG